MAIYRTGNTVFIEYDGSDGYDWATAFNWQDVVDASDTNGWGMTYQNHVYFIPFAIRLMEGTYFRLYIADESITLVFTGSSPDSGNSYWYRSDYGSFSRIGYTTDHRYLGVVRMLADEDAVPQLNRRVAFWGNVLMKNTIVERGHYGYMNGDSESLLATAENCYFLRFWFGMSTGDYTSLENVIKNGGYYGFQTSGTYSVDNVTLVNSWIAVLWSGGSGTWRNLKIQDNRGPSETYIRAGNGDKLATFLDCQIDKTKMNFYNSGSGSNMVEQELKTTFSIFVRDGDDNVVQGATVNVYGQDDTLLFTDITDVNGEISEESVRYYYKWRQVASGATVDEGTTDYEPLRVEVSKSGFDTITVNEIYIDPGVKTTMRQTLLATEPEPLKFKKLIVD
jgi:hypothetical protein